MYTVINFKTKKALREAVANGQRVEVWQPGSDLFNAGTPRDGRVFLEGPHAPEPHRWYAQATLKEGRVVEVK